MVKSSKNIAIVVPAYKPGQQFIGLLSALSRHPFACVLVVDDGSGSAYDERFLLAEQIPEVVLLRHGINLGKGAAIKTALNAILCSFPTVIGAITVDADGQHRAEDVIRVAEAFQDDPQALVMGVRSFDDSVPLRSRVGNQLTRSITRGVVGWNLSDTQTGLRAIPTLLFPVLLRISNSGYEFELDMLIAARHHRYRVIQIPIQTIYIDGNSGSHFDPIRDSMRIYFVLLRFGILSVFTALVDNLIFILAFFLSSNILLSQILGRLGGVVVNYGLARRAVFLSREQHSVVLPKYLALVVFSGAASYALIAFLHGTAGLNVIPAKLGAEALLFIANFAIQRDFVFRSNKSTSKPAATDWDTYYQSVPPTAQLTRKYTTKVLLELLERYTPKAHRSSIVEIGGANSCFLDAILHRIRPAKYTVIDNNEFGLRLLRSRPAYNQLLFCRNADVLEIELSEEADVVFSVGLIEHFDVAGTRRAVQSHFRLLKPGGLAIISFPTPTGLYRFSRTVLEAIRLWRFFDERPLKQEEVERAVTGEGEILEEKTLWPLVLTQRIIVVRKRSAFEDAGHAESARAMHQAAGNA